MCSDRRWQAVAGDEGTASSATDASHTASRGNTRAVRVIWHLSCVTVRQRGGKINKCCCHIPLLSMAVSRYPSHM